MISSLSTSNPLFRSAGQALHVAFLVMSTEPRQDAPLRSALMRMMESIDLSTAQADWYDELRGVASGTINFSGLTSLEVRAQCAMITSAVRSKLPENEMWAVQALFGQMDVVGRTNKQYTFQRERAVAILGLSRWLSDSFPGVAPLALDMMLAKVYANHQRIDVSFRELADHFGGSRMVYQRAFPKIRARLKEVERLAIDRLTPHFEAQGVCEPRLLKTA